jgi:LacI family transcriptional regulator
MGKIRMKDVAESLGVSASTVSRVLDGNNKISDKTREAVLDKLQELGYTPPVLARRIRRNGSGPMRIAVLCPDDLFFTDVVTGMKAARATVKADDIDADFFLFDMHDVVEQSKQLREIVADDRYYGIAIAPAHAILLNPLINELADKGRMVVTISTDAPQSKRAHYVGHDSVIEGGIAAQLCGSLLRPGEDIALVTSITMSSTPRERTEGFVQFLQDNYPDIQTLGPFEYNFTIESARDIAEQVIIMNPSVRAIFTNGMLGTVGCARAVADTGKTGTISVIGFDSNDEIRQHVQSGTIFASILQEPFRQGRQAMRALLNWLMYGIMPDHSHFHTNYNLLMKSTLACYGNREV